MSEGPKNVTAAVIIIGDEILSGRTKDQNLGFLADALNDVGVQLRECRVIPDVETEIVEAVNNLRAKLDYWRIKPPSRSDFEDQFFPGQPDMQLVSGGASGDNRCPIDTGRLWNHYSYQAILYGMDFLRDECREWYGENRPRPAVHKKVLDAINTAPGKLPPHDVWLKRMVGMADYSKS